jgi:tRNA (guanine37-N1)-methyltransferase
MLCALVTIFPELFNEFSSVGIVGKACRKGILSLQTTNPREFSEPPHYRVDDTPYGGGPGMVLMAPPIDKAISSLKALYPKAHVVYPTPSGTPFKQSTAARWSKLNEIVLLCGRYEGVDQRAIDLHVNEEVSLGDFILVGGEVAAMAMIEATVRLIPGVLGNISSRESESIGNDDSILLEAPIYTKPQLYRGLSVPSPLLSGNHEAITKWRAEESKKITGIKRA